MQKICRQLKKESGHAVDVSIQKEIFKKLENQSSQQTDLILANEFQLEVKVADKVSVQRDESQRLEFTFSKEEMEIISKAQSLLSNKTGGGLKDTILEMAKRIVKANEPKPAKVEVMPRKETNTFNATVAVNSKKTIPLNFKKEIKQRDQICQFVDVKSGRQCDSKHFLEIDHIQAKCNGGTNDKNNLRVLCKSHNNFRYRANLN